MSNVFGKFFLIVYPYLVKWNGHNKLNVASKILWTNCGILCLSHSHLL